MPGLSIHVVDVARGVPAAGMGVSVRALPDGASIADGVVGANGVFDSGIATRRFAPGVFEIVFAAGAYFAAAGIASPFLGDVPFRFTVVDPEAHIHLPLKITPWGFSIWRGA